MAFCLAGTLTVPRQNIAKVRAALLEHIALTRAEPGCLFFKVEEQDSGIFKVAEVFENEAAFKTHQTRAAGTGWAHASRSAERNYWSWEE